MGNPLLDKEFLKQLDHEQNRELYARILLLNFDESPVEDISGRITQGTVNIDSSSAIRRTCSLTLVTELDEERQYQWALDSKFKLEVGLKNRINPDYPDIIWFPQGIYFITTFSVTHNTNLTSINIQGKDKMAMLTGDVGGSVTSLSWDFGSIDEIDESGVTTVKKYLIKNIIREAVHEFAREPFHNIIINDLEDSGLELLQYNHTEPMYMLHDILTDTIVQFTLNKEQGKYYEVKKGTDGKYSVTEPYKEVKFLDGEFIFDNRNNFSGTAITPTYFTTQEYLEKKTSEDGLRVYTCIKAEKGETIGYRDTDLVYAGDLISSVGESITSMLDKIKNMLGDYEYFYNLDGQFVFQRRPITLDHPWNQLTDEMIVDTNKQEYSYVFDESNLITSFQNTPAISNVKNDFVVWGAKKSSSTPIHARYAIHSKPKSYKNFKGVTYTSDKYDWRELIYQMAIDYRRHMHDANVDDTVEDSIESFEVTLAENNPQYPDGRTGYEQFYTDLEAFWRDLYNPEYVGTYTPVYGLTPTEYGSGSKTYYKFESQQLKIYNKDNYYYKLYPGTKFTFNPVGKVDEVTFELNKNNYYLPVMVDQGEQFDSSITYFTFDDSAYYMKDGYDKSVKYWNKKVFSDPETLIFWFDFIDADKNSELSKFSIDNIGLRTIAKNDSAVKAIYYREVPNVLFIENTDPVQIAELKQKKTGYTILPLSPGLMAAFRLSTQGKSAKEEIDSIIYNKACCAESISITALPIYYLEPNTRILVKDNSSGIDGDYAISRISIPLAHTGTMNLSATKIIDRIY